MQLRRLKLKNFRNLRDVEIDFASTLQDSSNSGAPRAVNSHALIGQNGSGKSNLIEALVTIFRDLDLDNACTLDYELEYLIRGCDVVLEGRVGKRVLAVVDEKPLSATAFANRAKELLPAHVFAYYSGKNERIESLFRKHEQRFSKRMDMADQEVVPAHLIDGFKGEEEQAEEIQRIKDRREHLLRAAGEDILRRLFYCRGGHTQLVLLACFLAPDDIFEQILRDLNIVGLESALFVLKRPYDLRKLDEIDIQDGDNRFWYARGTVVSEFLDKLWDLAIAPITETVQKQIDFRGRREKQERLYLYLKDQEALRSLGDVVGTPSHFFRYAEGAYLADLIEEVRICVQHKDSEGRLEFRHLSEGELQLLTVLGLMRITHQDECLFLLDEPDTHLNPLWKLRYFETLEKVIRPAAPGGGTSQILITTHDPMMVGSLRREQVHILRKTESGTTVTLPDQDPVGMGVSGLLKSDLFGLRSTVDAETMRRIDHRYALYAKGAARSLAEDAELSRLSKELGDLGFAQDFRDPYFALFVQKMAQHTKFHKEILTPEEQHEQDKIADDIISAILAEEDAA
ncbi:MAG: AAA family ATPase [Fibrobacterota bacterium]|nr:MAG: AAA family ATPase [Fibrobacterota bacterium]